MDGSQNFPYRNPMENALNTRNGLLTLVMAVATVAIGTALASQYIGGLEPCKLCYWQRNPYYIAIPLLVAALLFLRNQSSLMKIIAWLVLAIFFIGFGVSAYHVGVEQGWWSGPTSCSSSASLGNSLDQQIDNLFNKPRVDCSKPAWTFFGISMAGLNAIVSIFLIIGSFKAATARS